MLLGILFTFAVAAYWIFERERTVDLVTSFLPRPRRKTVRDTWTLIDQKLGAFVRGELVLIAFVSTLASIALWIVGEPYWLLIGFAVGILRSFPWSGRSRRSSWPSKPADRVLAHGADGRLGAAPDSPDRGLPRHAAGARRRGRPLTAPDPDRGIGDRSPARRLLRAAFGAIASPSRRSSTCRSAEWTPPRSTCRASSSCPRTRADRLRRSPSCLDRGALRRAAARRSRATRRSADPRSTGSLGIRAVVCEPSVVDTDGISNVRTMKVSMTTPSAIATANSRNGAIGTSASIANDAVRAKPAIEIARPARRTAIRTAAATPDRSDSCQIRPTTKRL